MKKIMTGVATCALLLSGCANNEILDGTVVGNPDGAIKFGVSTPVTRASELYNNGNFITNGQKFNIVGLSSVDVSNAPNDVKAGDAYLGTLDAPKVLEYSAATTEWSYGASVFWPTSNLDFFSWYTGTTNVLGTPTAERIYDHSISFPTAYEPNTDVSKQLDILTGAGEYAKPAVNVNTTIQLKHATTQVVFKAVLAENSELQVKISEVAMMNVSKSGKLNLAVKPGKDNFADPQITWTGLPTGDDARTGYAVTYAEAKDHKVLSGVTNDLDLTVQTNSVKNGGAMLLIPQEFPAWNPSSARIDKTTGLLETAGEGAYIRVKCTINSKADGTGLWLHGANGVQTNLFIPVSSVKDLYGEWVPNRRITYVITFGDGGSGSGGGGWTGEPDVPVLTPIKLDVKVNEWDNQTVVLQSVNLSSADAVTVKSIKEQTDQFDMEVAGNPAKKYVAEFTFTNATALTAPIEIDVTGLASSKLNSGTVVKYTFTKIADIATTTNTISVTPPSGWEANNNGSTTWETTKVSLDGSGSPAATTLYLRKK